MFIKIILAILFIAFLPVTLTVYAYYQLYKFIVIGGGVYRG